MEPQAEAAATPSGPVRAGAVYLVGTVLQRGLSFLLLPFATRILGAGEFGAAAAASVVANLLSMALGLGLGFALVRLYYDDAGHDEDADDGGTRVGAFTPARDRRPVWPAVLWAQVFFAVTVAAVAWLTRPAWDGAIADLPWRAALLAAIPFGAAIAVQSTCQNLLRAAGRPVAFIAVNLLQTGIGATAGLLWATRSESGGYVSGLAVGAAAAAVTALVLVAPRPVLSLAPLGAALTLSLPFLLHQLSGWALNVSDRLIIERADGVNAVADYQVAYLLGNLLILGLDAVQSAWAPHFFGRLRSSQKVAVPAVVAVPATVTGASIALGLMALSPAVLALAAPPSLDPPRTVVALVLGACVVRISYLLAFVVVSDAKRSGSIAVGSAVAAVANVALNLALVPRFGLVAAGASTLVAYVIQALIVLRPARGLAEGLPLPMLAASWAGTAAVLLGVAQVHSWWVATAAVAAAAAGGGVALGKLRDGYRSAMTSATPRTIA